PSRSFAITIGPEIRYSRSGQTAGSLLFEQKPYGTGDFNLVALRGGVELDTRKTSRTSVLDVTSGVPAGDAAADLPPGRGLLALASASVTPGAWDVTHAYGAIDRSTAPHLGNTPAPP